MAVNLSPYGGVGAQFLDNAGNVLTGGKIETYAAGTTTPQATYTTSAGIVFHPNPIILDASGRVPSGGEIWLTDGLLYKFVLKDSNDVLIATYDNISGINSNFVNFVNQQEIQTATAGQTVFNLTTTTYQPGTNSLSVFVDGVNQYGPGAQYAYLETDSDTITFVNGLHVGASVKFTTSQLSSSAGGDAFNISYLPPFTGSVGTNVGDKLAQTVSIIDFGAVGDGITNDTVAIQAALTYAGTVKCAVYVPGTTNSYLITNEFTVPDGVTVYGDGWGSFIRQTTQNKDVFIAGDCNTFKNVRLKIVDGDNTDFTNCIYADSVNNLTVQSCFLESADLGGCGIHIRGVQNSHISGNRIYNGKWSSGSGPAASAADILLYSASASERHIIEANFCLSNNSQGIFVDALGFDGDIIISNNICVTLDPTTCTETGTWSLIANGGNRRHGIVIGYNNSSVLGPRVICDSNICRNTQWTGIYKQGAGAGSTTISNNLCDLNGYDVANSLSGGIFISDSGNESIVGNYITNYQNTIQGTGGITLVGGADAPVLVANNVIKGSLGHGLYSTITARNLKIDGNVFISNANGDIQYIASAAVTNVGGLVISNNQIYRTTGIQPGIYLDPQAGLLTVYITNNRITGFDNTTLSVNNAGISMRAITGLDKFVVKNNDINNFYYGVYSGTYLTTNRSAVLSYNTIKDCTAGFALGATTNAVTVPLIGNQFINVPTPTTSALGGGTAGRIVQQIGDNFIWQTTASPTLGDWVVGDRSQNSAPAVGSPKAWTCTIAGTPGTWVSEGNL